MIFFKLLVCNFKYNVWSIRPHGAHVTKRLDYVTKKWKMGGKLGLSNWFPS